MLSQAEFVSEPGLKGWRRGVDQDERESEREKKKEGAKKKIHRKEKRGRERGGQTWTDRKRHRQTIRAEQVVTQLHSDSPLSGI